MTQQTQRRGTEGSTLWSRRGAALRPLLVERRVRLVPERIARWDLSGWDCKGYADWGWLT